MANESAKDRRLIGYLLGQLSEAERTEVEDRYFAEDPLFEYLAAVELELIDAYARGELTESDRVQFERRLLKSTRFRTRIALALQLQARAAAIAVPLPVETSRPAPRRAAVAAATAERRHASPLVGVIAAGVAVVGAVGGWWVFQTNSPQAAAAVENAPAPAAPQHVPVSLPAAPPPMTVERLTAAPAGPVALVLSPGAAGNHEGTALLSMPPGADVVRIQVDHDGPARDRYAVIVSTRDRQRVWTELNMAPRAPGAKGVILEVPTASLPAGDYLVTLSGGSLQTKRLEPAADYSVRVR